MAALRDVVHYLRGLAREPAVDQADGELLQRFLARRDSAAFQELMRRHGPMVLGVCQRLARNPCDAEDAFQATFLILVRKGHTIRLRSSVGSWLYGVAFRTARKTRAAARSNALDTRADIAGHECPERAAIGRELWDLLDHELQRLPEKYRSAVVLCCLEGRTRDEAARLLRCPSGTVASRLARARGLLERRLARRGFAFSTGLLFAATAPNAAAETVPTSLELATVQAAGQMAAGAPATALSPQVAELMKGVLEAMAVPKIKVIGTLLLALAVLGVGLAALALPPLSPDQQRDSKPGPESASNATEPGWHRRVVLKSSARCIAFSPNGRTVAIGGGGIVRVWDIAEAKERFKVQAPKDWVSSVAFAADGQTLAAGSSNSIKLINGGHGSRVRDHRGRPGRSGGCAGVPARQSARQRGPGHG